MKFLERNRYGVLKHVHARYIAEVFPPTSSRNRVCVQGCSQSLSCQEKALGGKFGEEGKRDGSGEPGSAAGSPHVALRGAAAEVDPHCT